MMNIARVDVDHIDLYTELDKIDVSQVSTCTADGLCVHEL